MTTNIIVYKNNEFIHLQDCFQGVRFSGLRREAPNLEVTYVEFAGSDGDRIENQRFSPFLLYCNFYLPLQLHEDGQLKMREFEEMLITKGELFVINPNEPGKRYQCKAKINYEDIRGRYIVGNLSFSVFRGYSESINSTLSNFTLSDDWQFSQGLEAEDYSYTHQTSRFTIFNAGDFTIDPREHDLRIKIEGETEGELNVFNRTTGERFIYRPDFSSRKGDWVELDGVFPKRNGVNCGIDTNHRLITLVPGENEIELQNISRPKTSWDFRFLYK